MSCKVKIIIIANLLTCSVSYGQQINHKYDKFGDRLFFGGSVGLVIGQVTRIDILPTAGIWIFPQWSVGVSGRYTFHQQKYTIGSNTSFKSHIWGASGFTQILPIPDLSKIGVKVHGGLLLHGEYEAIYTDRKLYDPLNTDLEGKQWVKMYMVGGGYRQIVGDKSALYILVLWDLTNNEYSPYSTNPILRVSITF